METSDKKSVGILYICTGPYSLFWEGFYKSFERNFLKETKKKYFVFTDADVIYGQENTNVKKCYLAQQPWPLVTLLRFTTFLSIEEELQDCDYLMFANANIKCVNSVEESEFLPRPERGEELFVTLHPGYFQMSPLDYPYERSNKSTAYIPWNCGNYYVIGAMYGGTTEAFLSMSRTLQQNINEDLKNNMIAKWHDESHLNRYIIGKNNIRLLHPKYCYPFGMEVDYEAMIAAVEKQSVFDVKTFKGHYDNPSISFHRILMGLDKRIPIRRQLLAVFDFLANKKIN